MLGVLPAAFMADTPAQALYCRLLGARIGRDVHLGSVSLGAADLVRIDDGAAVGNDVRFANASVEGGLLRLGTIAVGADAYIGSRTVVESDTVIGAHGELDNLSALRSGSQIPAGEIWRGSPAAFHEHCGTGPPLCQNHPGCAGSASMSHFASSCSFSPSSHSCRSCPAW